MYKFKQRNQSDNQLPFYPKLKGKNKKTKKALPFCCFSLFSQCKTNKQKRKNRLPFYRFSFISQGKTN